MDTPVAEDYTFDHAIAEISHSSKAAGYFRNLHQMLLNTQQQVLDTQEKLADAINATATARDLNQELRDTMWQKEGEHKQEVKIVGSVNLFGLR